MFGVLSEIFEEEFSSLDIRVKFLDLVLFLLYCSFLVILP